VSAISASLVNMGDKVMEGRSSTPRTQRLLERADLPLRLGEWAVLRVVAIVVGVAGGILFPPRWFDLDTSSAPVWGSWWDSSGPPCS